MSLFCVRGRFLYVKYLFMCFFILLAGCGIESLPLSPSQTTLERTPESLLPFGRNNNNDSVKQSETDSKSTKGAFVSISELDQAGYDYSANFGIENDNLEDVFARITPKAGVQRRVNIIPLNR